MQRISKPDLVAFLRIRDHRRWLCPRIRYASIRSKPELLADLRRFFLVRQRGSLLELTPLSALLRRRLLCSCCTKTAAASGLPLTVELQEQPLWEP